ncbi:hypothetical protein JCM3766R1_000315 [Sporobolomyces carnicolor]
MGLLEWSQRRRRVVSHVSKQPTTFTIAPPEDASKHEADSARTPSTLQGRVHRVASCLSISISRQPGPAKRQPESPVSPLVSPRGTRRRELKSFISYPTLRSTSGPCSDAYDGFCAVTVHEMEDEAEVTKPSPDQWYRSRMISFRLDRVEDDDDDDDDSSVSLSFELANDGTNDGGRGSDRHSTFLQPIDNSALRFPLEPYKDRLPAKSVRRLGTGGNVVTDVDPIGFCFAPTPPAPTSRCDPRRLTR